MDKARKTAFEALLKMETDGGYSAICLNSFLKKSSLSPKDKAFASTLFYGVLERKNTLLFVLKRYAKGKTDLPVKYAVMMGFYQLLYMDSVPPFAAVNTSVEIIKTTKYRNSSGFVNGVLRSFLRDGKDKILNIIDTAEPEIKYSCSSKVYNTLVQSLGEDKTNDFLKNSFQRPPVYIRVNTLKTTPEKLKSILEAQGVSVSKCDILNTALEIRNFGSLEELQSFKDGLFHVQDLSSQLCCLVASAKAGQTVLDLCAAPGSKSFTVAEDMENEGQIYSFDVYDHKIELINSGAERLGIKNINAKIKDARDYEGRENIADVILCDVPCSGLGVLRRKPEIRYKEDDFSVFSELSRSILISAVRMLKVGGKLVFSTCTLNKEENEKAVERLISSNNCMKVLKNGEIFGKIKGSDALGLTILPEYFGSDGFYIACLEKVRDENE